MKYLLVFLVAALSFVSLKGQQYASRSNCHHAMQYLGKTPALSAIHPLAAKTYDEMEESFNHIQSHLSVRPVKQQPMLTVTSAGMPVNDDIQVILNFEGVHNANNSPNPDTEGDVGVDHYFQMVKGSFGIWDKEGNMLYGPADNSTLWSTFTGPWHSMGWTDPIVIYDHIADRWLASAMVYDLYNEYYEMLAVSSTPDPLGSWHCYALHFDEMPDYPKLGLWPDGYYLTFNHYELEPGISTFSGAGLIVFKRDDMIAGDPDPAMVYFRLDAPNESVISDPSSFFAADLDGPEPPSSTPNYLATIRDDAWGYDFDHLWLWKCSIDWEDTANCEFHEVDRLAVEEFDARWDDTGSGWIHQPNTTTRLHGHGHFLMYRLQYRNFVGHQSMLCCHAINVANDRAGMRWYELRKTGTQWDVFQSGTYSPGEDSRWMGSVAMDKDGNIALGYSLSGDNTYPSISATGRHFSDLAGAMTFPEATIATGGGNQSYNVRWGDYSMMGVDPADDLSFWYTQQFLPSTGWNTWRTRIAAFQLHKNLEADKDSLVFDTFAQCEEGLSLCWKNTSLYPVTVSAIKEEGYFESSAHWSLSPNNIVLPETLEPGDSLKLNIIVEFTTDQFTGYLHDTLDIETDYRTHQTLLCLNDALITNLPSVPLSSDKPVIRVHPNPFSENADVILETSSESDIAISLHDLRSVQTATLLPLQKLPAGKFRFRVPANIRQGVYLLHVRYNRQSIVRRIIKIP